MGTTVLLQLGTETHPDRIIARGDGRLQVERLRVPDGSGNYFEFYGDAGQLVIRSLVDNSEIRIGRDGGIRTRPAGAEASGSSGDGIRIFSYEGTLEDENVTVIETGLTTIRSVSISVEDSDGTWWAGEMHLAGASTRRLAVTFDRATGDITVSGDTTHSLEPGEEFQTRSYSLVVFA